MSFSFGYGCPGTCYDLEHACHDGLGVGALVAICTWNANIFMVWEREQYAAWSMSENLEKQRQSTA